MKARDASPTYTPLSQRLQSCVHKRLGSASDVFRETQDIRYEPVENFIMFSVNVRHVVIKRHVIARGCLSGVEVHPRDTFRPAIIDGAAALIFAHNHPSGDSIPSREDIELTKRLREIGTLVGIHVLDHVVVASDGFTSIADRGWV